MWGKKVIIIVLVLNSLTACATKQYPIATRLSPAEADLMTCENLELEILRANQVEQKINETGEFDGKTVLGFLGDFGIGNAMAKDEAREALSERRETIHEAQIRKGCIKAAPFEQKESLLKISDLKIGDVALIEFTDGKEREITITYVGNGSINGYHNPYGGKAVSPQTFREDEIRKIISIRRAK